MKRPTRKSTDDRREVQDSEDMATDRLLSEKTLNLTANSAFPDAEAAPGSGPSPSSAPLRRIEFPSAPALARSADSMATQTHRASASAQAAAAPALSSSRFFAAMCIMSSREDRGPDCSADALEDVPSPRSVRTARGATAEPKAAASALTSGNLSSAARYRSLTASDVARSSHAPRMTKVPTLPPGEPRAAASASAAMAASLQPTATPTAALTARAR
jgi:hypothetical protein